MIRRIVVAFAVVLTAGCAPDNPNYGNCPSSPPRGKGVIVGTDGDVISGRPQTDFLYGDPGNDALMPTAVRTFPNYLNAGEGSDVVVALNFSRGGNVDLIDLGKLSVSGWRNLVSWQASLGDDACVCDPLTKTPAHHSQPFDYPS